MDSSHPFIYTKNENKFCNNFNLALSLYQYLQKNQLNQFIKRTFHRKNVKKTVRKSQNFLIRQTAVKQPHSNKKNNNKTYWIRKFSGNKKHGV